MAIRSAELPRGRVLDAATLMALGCIVIWAGNNTIARWAIGEWQPLAYSYDRFVLGALVLLAFAFWRERSLRIARGDIALVLGAGLAGITINQIAFMEATARTNATTTSLIMAATPAVTAAIVVILGHEIVTGRHWIGLAMAAAGAALVLAGIGGGFAFDDPVANMFLILQATSWGIYPVFLRPLLERYSVKRISALAVATGTVFMTPFAWHDVTVQDYGAITTAGWLAVAYSLLLSLFLTNALWFAAINRAGAARVTAFIPIMPFLGALMAALFLAEHITLIQWLGGAVILLGLHLTRRPAAPR